MNLIPTNSNPPAHCANLPRQLQDRLAVLFNRLEVHPGAGLSISDRMMPTPYETRVFQDRAAAIRESLAPGDRRAMGLALAQMFSAFPSSRPDRETAELMTVAYLAQVDGEPLWALQKAVRDIVGEGDTFPPSAGQVARATRAKTRDLRCQLERIEKVLGAKVFHEPGESERAKIEAGFRQLVEGLEFNRPRNAWLPSKEQALQELAEAQRLPKAKLTISPEFAALLARQNDEARRARAAE